MARLAGVETAGSALEKRRQRKRRRSKRRGHPLTRTLTHPVAVAFMMWLVPSPLHFK